MSNCYRGHNVFRLRETLGMLTPQFDNGKTQLFKGVEVPGSEQLIYFAISVYWRAAVHKWWIGRNAYKINLAGC